MSGSQRVGVFVGSLRKMAFSRRLAHALIAVAPQSLRCETVEIGQLPLYNQDFDDEHRPPDSYATFRDLVRSLDAVLFVTPEYNRSVPAVLKNALDVASRPHGQSAWDGKPAAVISISPGAMGGFGANHHLRQSLVFLNCPAMQQPEAYIAGAAKLFDESGGITNESTKQFLTSFMTAFAKWVGVIRADR